MDKLRYFFGENDCSPPSGFSDTQASRLAACIDVHKTFHLAMAERIINSAMLEAFIKYHGLGKRLEVTFRKAHVLRTLLRDEAMEYGGCDAAGMF